MLIEPRHAMNEGIWAQEVERSSTVSQSSPSRKSQHKAVQLSWTKTHKVEVGYLPTSVAQTTMTTPAISRKKNWLLKISNLAFSSLELDKVGDELIRNSRKWPKEVASLVSNQTKDQQMRKSGYPCFVQLFKTTMGEKMNWMSLMLFLSLLVLRWVKGWIHE